MCVVSMIGDYYNRYYQSQPYYPNIQPYIQPIIQPNTIIQAVPEVSRAEFDALKKDVEQMKELLKRAKEYDEKNNEPDCEIEDKVALLRKVASLVGISLDDVLKPKEV